MPIIVNNMNQAAVALEAITTSASGGSIASTTVDLVGTWLASTTTRTALTSINTNKAAEIMLIISSVSAAAATETDLLELIYLSRSMRGALASLTVVSAERYLATATATQNFPEVTQALLQASLNIKDLFDQGNSYHADLILTPNAVFAAAFGLILLTQIGLFAWAKSWYFAVCFVFGTGLEFGGYLVRALSAGGNETNPNYFITQIVCLTIAPAFIMAGLYFMLAQMMIVTGPKSSVMKPLWFSYIFIGCDFISLLLQGAGGGLATSDFPHLGNNIMLAGIIFQVVTMSVFLYFLFDFYFRSFFAYPLSAPRTAKSFLQIFFATKQGLRYKSELESSYDPEFAEQRNTSPFLYSLLPLVMLVGVVLVYIRCVYRVAELAGGFSGYLYRTETFLMFLDALMVCVTCILFLIWHVAVVFGKKGVMSAKMLRHHARAIKGKKLSDDEENSVEK